MDKQIRALKKLDEEIIEILKEEVDSNSNKNLAHLIRARTDLQSVITNLMLVRRQ
jgi:hypothetical protein